MEEPTTYVETAKTWLVENGFDFAVGVLGAIVVLLVAMIVISMLKKAIGRALDRSGKVNELLRQFLVNIAAKGLWIIAGVIALSQVGIDVAPMIAGLGIAGFVLGFAFQDTLGNFAAGLMLLANDPFTKGHYVEVAGQAGTVKDLNIMATTLTTPDNRLVTIPNKSVWGQAIINYSVTGTRRIDMTVGVSYSADINKAKEVIKRVLASDDRILQDPAPLVEVVEMADSSVNFVIRPWSKTSDYWSLYFTMQQQLKEALDAAGIEIPFPQRVIHLQQIPAA